MQPICYELIITLDESQKDFISENLIELGETTFVEGSVNECDIEFDYMKPDDTDYYELHATNSPIILYGEDNIHLQKIADTLQKIFKQEYAQDLNYELKPIADQNWRDSWKESFKPVEIGQTFCILPPWENTANFSHTHKIVIDPGMAFGTGQHETTKLCLQFLINEKKYERLLDVGTGSGILAIAAKMQHNGYALGCDIDRESVQIAKDNAIKNGVFDIDFTDVPLDEITATDFDLVFANIQNKPLRMLMPEIVRHMTARSKLIISGILASECEDFCAFLLTQGLAVITVNTLGHWTGILVQKN